MRVRLPGKYATKTFTAGVQTDAAVGHFTATAKLTAKFGEGDERDRHQRNGHRLRAGRHECRSLESELGVGYVRYYRKLRRHD